MGSIISRWRKKPGTIEVLEKLDKQISSLESQKKSTLESQKRVLGTLLLYSTFLYLLSAVVVYFHYWPEEWRDRLYYSLPLLAFPLIIWLVRNFLRWYFVKRICKNEGALETLKKDRAELLEEVMEKETYKKAKEILERFDPEKYRKLGPINTTGVMKAPDGQELRQRKIQSVKETPDSSTRHTNNMQESTIKGTGENVKMTAMLNSNCKPLQTPFVSSQQSKGPFSTISKNGPILRPMPLPCPVLPKDRTVTDRLLDLLVGDGPSNRYALICCQCYSHNGMALKEEFIYTSFRCCYCYTLNEAREKKPTAPKIDTSPPIARKLIMEKDTNTGFCDTVHKNEGKPIVEKKCPVENTVEEVEKMDVDK